MSLIENYADEIEVVADEPIPVSDSEPSGETIRSQSTRSQSETGDETDDSFIVSDDDELEQKSWYVIEIPNESFTGDKRPFSLVMNITGLRGPRGRRQTRSRPRSVFVAFVMTRPRTRSATRRTARPRRNRSESVRRTASAHVCSQRPRSPARPWKTTPWTPPVPVGRRSPNAGSLCRTLSSASCNLLVNIERHFHGAVGEPSVSSQVETLVELDDIVDVTGGQRPDRRETEAGYDVEC